MAFEQLLAWAAGRPDWQQDALRRLAQNGELTEDDLSELRLQIETQAAGRWKDTIKDLRGRFTDMQYCFPA